MPELPEVEAIIRQLSPLIAGARVKSSSLLLPRIVKIGDLAALDGSRFSGPRRFGKFIMFPTDQENSLFVHLGMTGQLLWNPDENVQDPYVRVTFNTDLGNLIYRDVRSLGGMWVTNLSKPPWKELGLDPFDPEFSSRYLCEKLSRRKSPIKPLLLDQSIIAGVGNIYASEILYQAKIHPGSLACELCDKDISRLHQSVCGILKLAIEAQGTTFRDFRLSDGREGAFREFLKVYGHESDPCNICATPIVRIIQGGRSTYFCPECQKAPANR